MTEYVKGKKTTEIESLFEIFHQLVTEGKEQLQISAN